MSRILPHGRHVKRICRAPMRTLADGIASSAAVVRKGSPAHRADRSVRCRSRLTSRVVEIGVVSLQGRNASRTPSLPPGCQAILVERK